MMAMEIPNKDIKEVENSFKSYPSNEKEEIFKSLEIKFYEIVKDLKNPFNYDAFLAIKNKLNFLPLFLKCNNYIRKKELDLVHRVFSIQLQRTHEILITSSENFRNDQWIALEIKFQNFLTFYKISDWWTTLSLFDKNQKKSDMDKTYMNFFEKKFNLSKDELTIINKWCDQEDLATLKKIALAVETRPGHW